jgi:hypothetical protein
MANTLEDKDPADFKDYGIDWSEVLAAEAETHIDTSSWRLESPIEADGLVIASAAPYAPSIDGNITRIWVASGVAKSKYKVTNTIVTGSSTPRIHELTITIPVVERVVL